MWSSRNMGFQVTLLLLPFLLPPLVSAQLRSSSDSDGLDATSSLSYSSSTAEEELASMQMTSVGPSPKVVMKEVDAEKEDEGDKGEEKEEEDSSMPENYLYTGDASALSSTRCRRPFQLSPQRGTFPPDLRPLLWQAAVSLTNAANFLNLIFQASELRETSVREDIEWYHALVRGMLEGDRPGLVRRALLTFDADPTAPQPQLVLRASRGPSQDIYLQDLTLTWESLISPPSGHSWFTSLKSSMPPLPGLSKRVLLNDLSTLDTPKWARGDSYITNSSGLRWGETPFLECEDGRYLPGWLLTLSIPFYGLKPDLSPEFRGVVRVDVNIQGFDVDQCASGNVWFSDTHQCNRTSMECDPIPRQGFRLGQYCCRCKEGYYSPPSNYKNKMADGSNSTRTCYPNLPVCLPCWPGCKQCKDSSPCWVQEDWLLRAAVLAVQGIFMALVLLSMLRAYQCRRTKRIRASGLMLLEMILFGSLLLYFPVFILYFKPSTFRCILLRWVRLLGFAIVYGTLTLKMYRVLKVFLSRTAQRVPYMSSTTAMKMLGVMVLTVSWFLCAWTAGVLQNRDRNVPVLITSTTSDGQGFSVCDLDRWDHMMAVAELLFLCWGSFLCNAVKAVPSAFHEPRYMGIAIHNELLLSAMFHLFRFARPSLHPDWMLLLFFTHTHVTITVTLGLLFLPKFLYISRPVKEEVAAEVYEDEVDLRRSCSYLNSSFTSTCWSDHSLDPDDIRDELKKLYAQLEVHKTKKMANNNPHLQKKRSSRLTLGRSLIKRIAEIPESLSRQCSREEKDMSGIGGMRKWSGAFMSTPDSASIKNETVKLPSPKMRKSLSAYEYYPEKDSSRKSSMRNSIDKRSSHISEAESIDTALLICKSASAHNLAVDNNLLQPVSTRFQKSLSFTEKHRDHYPLCPTRSMEDASLAAKTSPVQKVQRPQGSIKEQTSNALLCLSFDKSEVCPWEVEEEQPAGKNLSNQKHVTYSLSQEQPPTPETASSPTRLFVCPWEGLPPPPPPAAEGGLVADADVDSPRPKPPISSSAPGSPHGFAKPKDHRGFSFRSATQSLLVVRGLGKGSGKDKSKSDTNSKDDTSQQTRATSMKLTPGTAATSGRRTPQTPRRAMTTVETKPCLVKQEAVRLSSYDSPERSPKGSALTQICPWESKEIVMEVKKLNPYEGIIQKQGSKHRLSLTLSTDSNKSSLLHVRPSLTVPKADVCPWDVPTKPQLVHQQSSIANICPWEVEESDQLQAKEARDDICPWETDDQEPQMTKEKKDLLNICPWETSEVVSSTDHKSMEGFEQRRSSIKPDVCPWDVSDTSTPQVKQDPAKPTSEVIKPTERVIYVNTHPNESPLNKKGPGEQEKISSDVCPWETSEAQMQQEDARANVCPWESGQDKGPETTKGTDSDSRTKTRLLTKQLTSNAEACPWDYSESSQPDVKGPESQERVHSNICPWESEQTPKTDAKEQSQEAAPVKKNLLTKQMTNTAETCPWDFPEATPTVTKSEGASSNPNKETAEVTSQSSATKNANVCPWEAEQSERTEGKGSIKTKEREKSLLKQDSKHADVCPWETSEPVRKQEVASSEVCPWETDGPVRKQEAGSSEVCPWETGEPVRKQEAGSSEVCPWETGEPVRKQEAGSSEVCPWEIGEPVRKQEVGSSDICSWETGKPDTEQPVKSYQKQASLHSRQSSEREKPVQKQESICADIRPWDTEQSPKLTSSQDKSQADIYPQKHEDSEISKMQEGACADDASAIPGYEEVSGDQCVTQIIQTDAPLSAGSAHTPQGSRGTRPLTRCDALCPWEIEGEPQASIIEHDNNSDVFTWEEPIPEEEEGDAETAAEAFIFPPDL
ncbi:probable G-protein coupled receptor 158 [Astyanax mexicanus]|uniref:probable G-protein coupled receptor 158 n=1 Tax=Astyanax mexicanus TaxID=7994 RepID=UPI0020CB1B65|nr:probable G-protein coupled receptor 158 [Astyanax mexicanus]